MGLLSNLRAGRDWGYAYSQIAWAAWMTPAKRDWRRKIETRASSLAGGLFFRHPIRPATASKPLTLALLMPPGFPPWSRCPRWSKCFQVIGSQRRLLQGAWRSLYLFLFGLLVSVLSSRFTQGFERLIMKKCALPACIIERLSQHETNKTLRLHRTQ